MSGFLKLPSYDEYQHLPLGLLNVNWPANLAVPSIDITAHNAISGAERLTKTEQRSLKPTLLGAHQLN